MECVKSPLKGLIEMQTLKELCKAWELDTIILFGSVLTENFNEASDVDIALLGQRKLKLSELMQIEMLFEDALGRDIDVIDLRSEQLDLFVKINILNSGQILCTADDGCSVEAMIEEVERYYRENENYFYFRRVDVLS